MADELEQTTKSDAKSKGRPRKRPAVYAKRLTVGLTDVQLDGLERMRQGLQAAAPEGHEVTKSDALRALVEEALAEGDGGAAGSAVGSARSSKRVGRRRADGLGHGPGSVPVVALTQSVHQSVVSFGEALADVEATLRHPLGTNINQIARRLNARAGSPEAAEFEAIKRDLAVVKERLGRIARAVNLGVMRWEPLSPIEPPAESNGEVDDG